MIELSAPDKSHNNIRIIITWANNLAHNLTLLQNQNIFLLHIII